MKEGHMQAGNPPGEEILYSRSQSGVDIPVHVQIHTCIDRLRGKDAVMRAERVEQMQTALEWFLDQPPDERQIILQALNAVGLVDRLRAHLNATTP